MTLGPPEWRVRASGRWLARQADNSPTGVRANGRPKLLRADRTSLVLGNWTKFYEGVMLVLHADGSAIEIGDRSYVMWDTRILARRRVTIGERCAISWNVTITDSDYHRIDGGSDPTADVRIGDHVWIGAHALVLKGVEIGDGAIVGAGAVVNRDVPPGCLVAGNPARVVRRDVEWGGLRAGD